MKLSKAILRPGTILSVLENGQITASAPGLFSSEDADLLPPIMPWWELCGTHTNVYSEPVEGDEVWVLNVTDNPLQLYWFRKDDSLEHNQSLIQEGNCEILCNRESGLGYATIYFSDGSGWVIRNDESKLQIYPDGHIEMGMNWPHRTIKIDPDAIHVGSGEKEHPACFGDITSDIFTELYGMLTTAAEAAKTTPYTMAIGSIFETTAEKIKSMIPEIISTHVKID
jgi:hypothetical protein